MIEKNISLPEMILWTGTRVALGAGIGMLISRRLGKDAMKAAGLALTLVGAFTTIPLAISIMSKKNLPRPEIRSVA
jgi:myo-inositol catabolism protein IolC